MQQDSQQHRKIASGNLILIGLMGSGKTTVGRALSKHTGKPFLDSDEEIQKRTGVTISHIFDIEGEAGFRQREASVLRDLVTREGIILATGGGAVLLEENRRQLSENGIVVYLDANVSDLWHRTRHDRNRPLLQNGDAHAKLRELHTVRSPIYREVADICLHSGRQSVHALMLNLLSEIETFKASHE